MGSSLVIVLIVVILLKFLRLYGTFLLKRRFTSRISFSFSSGLRYVLLPFCSKLSGSRF